MRRRPFLRSALASVLLTGADVSRKRENKPRLLVGDSVGSTLNILDARTFAREGRIPLGQRPREVVVSPDGSVAYVSIYGPGVYGQNPTPGHEIAVIDVPGMRLS